MTTPTKAERRAVALKAYRDATEPVWKAYMAVTEAAWKAYNDALRAIGEEP